MQNIPVRFENEEGRQFAGTLGLPKAEVAPRMTSARSCIRNVAVPIC